MKLKIILLLIITLSFLVRLYNLRTNPPALYWDEVSIGLNAEALIKTGADEYGHKLPLFFEAFQEYKLPGYIYSVVPFVKIFGMDELSVRLPAVIYGVFTVLLMYLLVSKLINKKVGLLSAFFMSITPWAVLFSRAGFEANAGVSVLTAGMLFLVLWVKQKKFLTFGIILLFLSTLFYNSNRVFVPIFICTFFMFFLKRIWSYKKSLIISLFVGIVITIPLLFGNSLNRFSYVSVFNDLGIIQDSVRFRQDDNTNLSRLFHYRYFSYGRELFKNYMSHFSPQFLLFNLDGNPRHNIPGVGLIFLIQFPLFIFGFITMHRKIDDKSKVLLSWMLLSPLASSLAIPSPHALRGLLMFPPMIIYTAYGLDRFTSAYLNRLNHTIPAIFTCIISISFLFFIHQLFVHYPIYSNRDWAFGYKEIYQFVQRKQNDYINIYVTGRYWRPYIFSLFYLNTDLAVYQNNVSHNKIGNIYFGYASYDTSDPYYNYSQMEGVEKRLRNSSRNLLILSPEEKHSEDKIIKVIYDLEKKPLFIFVET